MLVGRLRCPCLALNARGGHRDVATVIPAIADKDAVFARGAIEVDGLRCYGKRKRHQRNGAQQPGCGHGLLANECIERTGKKRDAGPQQQKKSLQLLLCLKGETVVARGRMTGESA